MGRGGFTLLELLVALVISGLLVSVIFQLLQGNSRFLQSQSAREEVQQNARAALGLIAADLRTVPPTALTRMDADSIRFYMPRAWGVLCNAVDPTTTTAWVLFPAGVLPTDNFWNQPHWGVAVEQTTSAVTHTGVYQWVSQPTQASGTSPCASIEPNLNAQHAVHGFNGSGFSASGTVPAGAQVMLFEEMKYDVASSGSGVTGSWIRRMLGYAGTGQANMQPMAGPVPAAGGLSFGYLQADGTTAATAASQVRQIRVRVVVESRAQDRTGTTSTPQQVDTLQTTVYLRNAPG